MAVGGERHEHARAREERAHAAAEARDEQDGREEAAARGAEREGGEVRGDHVRAGGRAAQALEAENARIAGVREQVHDGDRGGAR